MQLHAAAIDKGVERVHVAVIGLRGIPDVMGGIEAHCSAVLPKMLNLAGNEALRVTVLARRPYVPIAMIHKSIGQIPLTAPRNGKMETLLHTVWAVLYARFALKVDGVHLHGIGPALTAPLIRLLGMKLLLTHHGEDYARQKWGRMERLVLRLGETLGLLSANRIICVAKS